MRNERAKSARALLFLIKTAQVTE